MPFAGSEIILMLQIKSESESLVKQHILATLTGSHANDFIKADKSSGPDVIIRKLHLNFLLQNEPDAVAPEIGKELSLSIN